MTVARVSRVAIEVISSEPAPTARVSRVGIEVISSEPAPTARVSRLNLEILQSQTELVPTAPTAPTGLIAIATGQTTVDLLWNNVADETGYRIERSGDGIGGWLDLGDVAANTVVYSDTGLVCSTDYFYRVFAFNANGDSTASNVAPVTTDACDPSTLTVVGNEVTVTGTWIVTIGNQSYGDGGYGDDTYGGTVVYQDDAGNITLPAGTYFWTSTDGISEGTFTIAAPPVDPPPSGGNRMGGSQAIRKPPRS